MGVAWLPILLPTPVVSYTTFSPLPGGRRHPGGRFLWSFPRVSPPGSYPAPCSVERGLSSEGLSLLRLPSRPMSVPIIPSEGASGQPCPWLDFLIRQHGPWRLYPPIQSVWLDSARVARRTWEECAWSGYEIRLHGIQQLIMNGHLGRQMMIRS